MSYNILKFLVTINLVNKFLKILFKKAMSNKVIFLISFAILYHFLKFV